MDADLREMIIDLSEDGFTDDAIALIVGDETDWVFEAALEAVQEVLYQVRQ